MLQRISSLPLEREMMPLLVLAPTSTAHPLFPLPRGNVASVLRIVPYAAIHFSAYEWYRRLLVQHAVPAWDDRRRRAAAASAAGSSGGGSSSGSGGGSSSGSGGSAGSMNTIVDAAEGTASSVSGGAAEVAEDAGELIRYQQQLVESSSSSSTSSTMPLVVQHQSAHVHPVWDLLAGSAAGATAVMLTYPLDLVRCGGGLGGINSQFKE